jgi:CheY-like chemotaxis protein
MPATLLSRPGSHRPRVLVVDDEPDAAESLGALLADMGCEPAVFTDALTAIDAAGEFEPQLVIIDLNMRGLDGCETLREGRRRHAVFERSVCVCVSGNHEPAEKRRCMQEGFTVFLDKPVDVLVLGELIAQLRPAPA